MLTHDLRETMRMSDGGQTGLFITLEGIDGSGKSTQAARLVDDLVSAGVDVVSLREPGGTDVSERIRALLLDPANSDLCPTSELLLYEAARAQLVSDRIVPALARGAVVICDRFYDSTTAYQGAARGLDADVISRANLLGSCGTVPDRTVIFDLDPACALGRATAHGADRLEGEGVAFQQRVRSGYLGLASAEPGRVRLVDADGTLDEVRLRLHQALSGFGLPLVDDMDEEVDHA